MDSARRTRRSTGLAAKGVPLALFVLCLLLLFPSSAFALFTNGGFETGDFTGWTTTTFLNPGLSGSPPFVGSDIQRSSGGSNLTMILGSPTTAEMSLTDANTDGVLHYPLSGHYCAVVNYMGANRNGNTLTQTATVGPDDVKADGLVHVQSAWAAVVENPNHTANAQPYVYVHVRDVTTGTDLYSAFIFAGDGSIWNDVPNSPNAVQFTNWQTIDLAPGGISVGDSIELDVTAAGCSLGGHWGYVYVDHFGSFQPVTANVTAADKPYNGTTAATITGGSLTGVQGSDDVTLNTSGATATFDTPDPGTGKTVTVQGLALSGADADKYILSSSTATTQADITTAATIAVTPPATTDLGYGDTTQVTATATDADGNPIPGLLVTFTPTGGNVSPTSVLTDANGQATTTFTAGSTDGSATVTASVPGSDGGPAVQDVADLYVDGTPPTTTATNTQANGTSGWSDQDVSVSLDAQDNGPGAVTTYYELDGSTTPVLYDGTPLLFTADGSHSIEYWSVDAADNEGTHHTGYVNIDETPPSISSGADGMTVWSGQDVTVTLTASDTGGSGLATVQYRPQGTTTWLDPTNDQFTVAAPSNGSNDGAHVFEYQATDGAGNVTQGTCTVGIDSQPPITNVDVQRDDTNGDVTITFLPADLGSGMTGGQAETQYQVDGGSWVTGTQVVLRPLADGSNDGAHTVAYRSTDALGHVEVTRTATVYLTAGAGGGGTTTYTPQTALLGLNGIWRNTDADLSLHAYEDPAGPGIARTEYSLDDGQTWTTGSSLVIAAPADHSNDGAHLLCYRSIDNAGTVEPTRIAVVGIDTRQPTAVAEGASTAWRRTPLSLTFTASDPSPSSGIARIECSTTGGNSWTARDGLTVSARGTTTVLYRAIDDAGNVSGVHTTWVRIDNLRPWTKAAASTGHGALLRLRFRIYDAKPSCGTARVMIVVINARGKVVARYRLKGWYKTNATIRCRVKTRLAAGHYRFLVRATDRAGNVQSKALKARLTVR